MCAKALRHAQLAVFAVRLLHYHSDVVPGVRRGGVVADAADVPRFGTGHGADGSAPTHSRKGRVAFIGQGHIAALSHLRAAGPPLPDARPAFAHLPDQAGGPEDEEASLPRMSESDVNQPEQAHG